MGKLTEIMSYCQEIEKVCDVEYLENELVEHYIKINEMTHRLELFDRGGFGVIFSVELIEGDMCYYVDVSVKDISKGEFVFRINFGENEEGDIDIEYFTVTNEIEYSLFLTKLKNYLIHSKKVINNEL